PAPRDLAGAYVDPAPPDLLHRVAGNLAAEGLRHELSAKAVAEHRDAAVDGGAYERKHLRNPRKAVVCAHRPAHEDESAEVARIARNGLTLVDFHHPP